MMTICSFFNCPYQKLVSYSIRQRLHFIKPYSSLMEDESSSLDLSSLSGNDKQKNRKSDASVFNLAAPRSRIRDDFG